MLDSLLARADSQCELCESSVGLVQFDVGPTASPDDAVILCETCHSGQSDLADDNHWRVLQESIWSEHAPVQLLSWRLLTRLSGRCEWAREALDGGYLEESLLAKAQAGMVVEPTVLVTRDSNGTELHDGDTITLIKGLDVKGANFTAKRGTTVKNIRLTGDPGLVEGRINKMSIVLKTEFLKRIS